ncbi:DUF6455 family protein [Rhodopila globiformis]|uniref:DUF6455 domain-containing protein n=1 Tax=Rhodopila globiformis TaxID=1071 RepID=A0A2S6NL97_RHOGL|nr:DUF6455 family protein [Rhodopila globiformis]PPQ35974.1 hypothetical protein CCS01_06185 [Rhodopila globiformis]
MSASGESSLLSRVLDWIKARLAQDSELAAMSYQDLQFLASDIGVSVSDLRAIGPRITDHDALMKQMMLARGLDPDVVRLAFSGVMRDIEVTCARCRDARACQRELAAGSAAEHCHEFCPNAPVMDELLEIRSQPH